MYISGIEDYPELDLEEMMNRIFDYYPEEFREYWGLDADHVPADDDPDRWERRKELDVLAKRIAGLAGNLVRPPKLRDTDLNAPVKLRDAAQRARKKISELLQELRSRDPEVYSQIMSQVGGVIRVREDLDYGFLRAALQLYLSGYLVWPRDLAERVVNLTQYAARVRNTRTIQYLERVSRCYLYNMPAELAVMARAVVECALEDAIPEDQVRAARRIPSNRRASLTDYIEIADGTILAPSAASAARQLKQFGDDAIHVSAQLAGNPDHILELLLQVLGTLER